MLLQDQNISNIKVIEIDQILDEADQSLFIQVLARLLPPSLLPSLLPPSLLLFSLLLSSFLLPSLLPPSLLPFTLLLSPLLLPSLLPPTLLPFSLLLPVLLPLPLVHFLNVAAIATAMTMVGAGIEAAHQ